MSDTQGLDPAFGSKINALIAASHGAIYIVSGYRSPEKQAQLYAAAVQKYGAAGARKWVAPPGHSNHNKGMAVDLGGDMDLAHKLAPQFGLVFPMSWEPWHIEPPGARSGATPQAYTEGPAGTTNPVDDQAMGSSDQFLMASLSDALLSPHAPGADADPLATPLSPTSAPNAPSSTVANTPSVGQATTPGALSQPPHPSGQGMTTADGKFNIVAWAHDFLTAGGFPTTPENMRAIQAWAQAEGGVQNNNPLNTTQGGYAGHSINSVGVMNYNSYDDSIKANLQALNNGRYPNVIAALKTGTSAESVGQAIEASPWGTGGGVLRVLGSGKVQ